MEHGLFRELFDAAPDPTVVVDAQGAIAYGNFQLEAVFGYLPSELIGQPVEILLPDRFALTHPKLRARFLDELQPRPMGTGLKLYGRHKNGSEFPVDISLSPVKSEDDMFVVSAIRDITERVELENALRVAVEAADEANTSKSRFLAMASHDLRQPVQSLVLTNELLGDLVPPGPATEAINRQKHSLQVMTRLLSALTEISRLESGSLRTLEEEMPVSSIFRALRLRFEEQARGKGLDFVVGDCEEIIITDPLLIEQLLQNLLTNAIRYTLTGQVQLMCICDPDAVRIEVVDTGIGIPQDELTAIFREFHQLPPVDGRHTNEGFGLGLAIVKRIASLLGYDIDVASTPSAGSRFSVSIPKNRGSRASPDPAAS